MGFFIHFIRNWRNIACLVGLAVLEISFSQVNEKRRSTHGNEPRHPEQLTAAQMNSEYRVVGILGKALGEFMTLRGYWKADWEHSKSDGWLFLVTDVDGAKLEHPVPFTQLRDLRLDKNADIPEEKDGAIWEMRAYESITIPGVPNTYYKELGLARQGAAPGFRFYNELCHIHVVELE